MNKLFHSADVLPEGWAWTTISDLVGKEGVFVDGDWVESKDQDQNGNVRLIQLADIGDGEYRNKSKRFLKYEKAIELCCTFLKKGDVLIARMPDPLGRSCIFPGDLKKSVTVVDVAIVRPGHADCESKWLMYFINAPAFRHAVSSLESGTTRKRISRSNLATIRFPLPPLPEQHAIVSKIEQLFSELDKGIESLKIAQQQLKVYRQSVLKWAFEGKMTEKWRQNQDFPDVQDLLEKIQKEREEKVKARGKKLKPGAPLTKEELADLPELPKGWAWVNIEKIVDTDKYSLKAGPFGSSLKKEFYVEKGYKIYGQEQVIAGNSLNGDYYISKEKFEELISNKIQPHDILISLVGTVGKVLILPEHCEPGIINPRLIKVTLNRNYYNPLFFKYYFESSFLKSLYSSKAQGTTMDVLNLGIIKALPFPICSIPEQHQIVQEIESRLSECDNMEATIATSLQQAEALRQSILKKAFEGRLLNDKELEAVRQDPTWEPAEKLLERIRVEKSVLHSGKKDRKNKA